MKFKAALLSLSAAAALVAPVAAQAGTTAQASTGKISTLAGLGERKAASVKAKNKADGGTYILGALAIGAATWGVIELADGNKSNGS